MFDPVSLIVAALVSGFLGGVESVAQEAVLDGYRILRGYLIAKYGQRLESSIDDLARNPRSEQAQQTLARELVRVGADRDPHLAQLANNLIELMENSSPTIHATEEPDLVEKLRRSTGLGAVRRMLDDHVGKVLEIRSRYDVDDVQLLSGSISRRREIAKGDINAIAGLHRNIRTVIEQIANHIEQGRYEEVRNAIVDLPAGLAEQQRANRLVNTDMQIQVSYEALRLTVEFFSELNQLMLDRIEKEMQPDRQSNMMFGNAVMIFELTDFVIGYVEGFSLSTDLNDLHADAKRRVKETRSQQRALEARIRTSNVEPAVRDQTLEDIRRREQAITELENEWEKYVSEVKQLKGKVDEVRAKVPTLEVIRENARIQIMTLQLVAMLRFLKQNSDSIRGAVDTLQGFRLAPLSPTRVRRLLGV